MCRFLSVKRTQLFRLPPDLRTILWLLRELRRLLQRYRCGVKRLTTVRSTDQWLFGIMENSTSSTAGNADSNNCYTVSCQLEYDSWNRRANRKTHVIVRETSPFVANVRSDWVLCARLRGSASENKITGENRARVITLLLF